MKDHHHKAIKSREKAYTGPVNRWDEDPRAHGNICVVETCECGAERHTNVNFEFQEVGPWHYPKKN